MPTSIELLGLVMKDAGILYVVLGETAALATWSGSVEKEYKKLEKDESDGVVGKDGRRAVVDLGGATYALVVRAHGGIVLGAHFPKKSTAKQRALAAPIVARPAAVPTKLGTISVPTGKLSLGWALDAYESGNEDWLEVSLAEGAYDVYADATTIQGAYGSVDERVFIIPAGAELETVAPPAAVVPQAIVGSWTDGRAERVVIASLDSAVKWDVDEQFQLGYQKLGSNDDPGACMIGDCCFAQPGWPTNDGHVVARPDGSFVISTVAEPEFEVPVDLEGFVDAVSVAPRAAERIGELVLTGGELVVAYAGDFVLKNKQIDALRKTGKPQDLESGVAIRVPGNTYDLWFDATEIKGKWGSLQTRCYLVPKGGQP